MQESTRNVALVSSVVYGVLLVCGWVFFCFTYHNEPLYKIRSTPVATFYVFLFAFLPSLFFLGGTVPWMCAAYDSEPAAIAFAVVPGGIFVVGALLWIFLGDVLSGDDSGDLLKFLEFRPAARRNWAGGPYPQNMLDQQGMYGVGSPEAHAAGGAATGYSPRLSRAWAVAGEQRTPADVYQQVSPDPHQPPRQGPHSALSGYHWPSNIGGGSTSAAPWLGTPRAMAASLGDRSGTAAPVPFRDCLPDDNPNLVSTPVEQQQQWQSPALQLHPVPSPFRLSARSRGGGSSSSHHRSPLREGEMEVRRGSAASGGVRAALWLDEVGAVTSPEPLFSAHSSTAGEEVFLDIPFSGTRRQS